MSRVGKKPIGIPEGVEVKIDGKKVVVKGPKGELSQEVRPEIKVEVKEGKILVSPQAETKKTKAFWGLIRALLNNMIKGVTAGFEKKLEIKGVGFRAKVEGEDLVLSVGFSHSVKIEAPEGIWITRPDLPEHGYYKDQDAIDLWKKTQKWGHIATFIAFIFSISGIILS